MNTLANQVKCPEVYNNCLGCKAKDKVEVNDDENISQGTCLASHEQSSFADGNVNISDNQGTCFADVNENQGTCFADVNDNVNGETWTKSHHNGKILPSLQMILIVIVMTQFGQRAINV